MKVLHLSDVHVDVPWTAFPRAGFAFPKRLLGGANLALNRKRAFRDARDKLRDLSRFRREQGIDLVICTGDLTALGTVPELEAAREAIAPLTDAPAGFVVIPGNHDVYVSDSVGHFDRIFAGLVDDGPYPRVRIVDDEVAVVQLNSARPNPQPWRSSGRVSDDQLAKLPAIFESLGDRFVFIALHYGLRLENGEPDRFSHGLVNADEVLRACASVRGAILHGHIHQRFQLRVPGVTPPIYCAGSTTEAGHEGFWVYEVVDGTLSAMPGTYRDGHYRFIE